MTPSRFRRSPTPISTIKSTVLCSRMPARMVSSMSARGRLSSTTDSMPDRCSRCESMSPAGPAPTMPTCVRIPCHNRRSALGDRYHIPVLAGGGKEREFLPVPDQEVLDLAFRHRTAEKEALTFVAAFVPRHIELLFALDAF